MKRLIYLATLLSVMMISTSCGDEKKDVKWEYKVVRSEALLDPDYKSAFANKYLYASEERINELGDDGWELVSAFTEVETAHPNYGNDKYVTGLQPNVRSAAVTMIFKRPKQEESAEAKDTPSSGKSGSSV